MITTILAIFGGFFVIVILFADWLHYKADNLPQSTKEITTWDEFVLKPLHMRRKIIDELSTEDLRRAYDALYPSKRPEGAEK